MLPNIVLLLSSMALLPFQQAFKTTKGSLLAMPLCKKNDLTPSALRFLEHIRFCNLKARICKFTLATLTSTKRRILIKVCGLDSPTQFWQVHCFWWFLKANNEHFQIHIQFWVLQLINNCFVHSSNSNHKVVMSKSLVCFRKIQEVKVHSFVLFKAMTQSSPLRKLTKLQWFIGCDIFFQSILLILKG